MYDVKDKVVLVTGGASGIGAEVVKGFLNEGAKHVAFLDVDEEKGKNLESEVAAKHGSEKVKFHKCDVTNTDELSNSYEEILKTETYIDVVINNAGIFNDKHFKTAVGVNVTAVIENSLKAYNLMRKDRGGVGGTIINAASVVAFVDFPFTPVYGATRAAVVKFSTSLGNEFHYSRSSVRVLSVCFGGTATCIYDQNKSQAIDEETQDALWKNMPVDHFQTAEAAAKGVVEAFTSGDSASVWVVKDNTPAKDITKNVTEAYGDIVRSLYA